MVTKKKSVPVIYEPPCVYTWTTFFCSAIICYPKTKVAGHNSENYSKCTRQFNNFYQPITNFTIYQRGVYYMGIKIFNNLPPYIKDISNNVRKFEFCLKWFPNLHSFYSTEEYFQYKIYTDLIIYVLSLSLTKKKFNIVMLMLFLCLKLLSVFICYNCSFCIWRVSLLITAISFYALSLHSGCVLSVLKHHSHTWLGISFVWFQTLTNYNFTYCITLDMFYILLIVFICGFMECK